MVSIRGLRKPERPAREPRSQRANRSGELVVKTRRLAWDTRRTAGEQWPAAKGQDAGVKAKEQSGAVGHDRAAEVLHGNAKIEKCPE